MKNLTPQRLKLTVLCLLFGWSMLFAAYADALWAPFFWDDRTLIVQNPMLHSPDAWGKIFQSRFWELPHRVGNNTYYRPIVIASFVLDAQLWKLDPLGFHLTNLILHLANCGLLFWIVRRQGMSAPIALLAMLLFGALPRVTESATWISGRTDLLAAFGAVLAIAWYRREPYTFLWRIASALALLVGLLSKEVALAALPALIVYEWSHARNTQRSVYSAFWESTLRLLPVFLITSFYFGLRMHADVDSVATSAIPLSLGERIGTVVQVMGTYAWMLLTPYSPHLGTGTVGVFEPFKILLGIAVLGGLLFVALRILRRPLTPMRMLFLTLGIAALIPVLHILPLQIRDLAADRFLYLPWFGFCALLATYWPNLSPRFHTPAAVIVSLLALSFLWSTKQRNSVWTDDLELWKQTAATAEKVTPQNGIPYCEAGTSLTHRGKFEEAISFYERCYATETKFYSHSSRETMPTNALANWGLSLTSLGRSEEAMHVVELLGKARIQSAEEHLFFGTILARLFLFEAADQQFELALKKYPNYADAQRMRTQTQRAAQILAELPPAAQDEPTLHRAKRGYAYLILGRVTDANRLWLEVVRAPDATRELLEQSILILEQLQYLFGESEDVRALADAVEKKQNELRRQHGG